MQRVGITGASILSFNSLLCCLTCLAITGSCCVAIVPTLRSALRELGQRHGACQAEQLRVGMRGNWSLVYSKGQQASRRGLGSEANGFPSYLAATLLCAWGRTSLRGGMEGSTKDIGAFAWLRLSCAMHEAQEYPMPVSIIRIALVVKHDSHLQNQNSARVYACYRPL